MRIFHRRPLVETTHSRETTRGGSVAARRAAMIRVEILARLVLHNLTLNIKNYGS